MTNQSIENAADRRQWMAVLAKADFNMLESMWSSYDEKPQFSLLRKPETGLVMVRGRMGGKGRAFNLGEATVTRCSVKSSSDHTGHAYLLGRNQRHAQIAAEIDALMQDEQHRAKLEQSVLEPLLEERNAKLELERQKTAATKVDFFTMVRGEDD